MLHEDGVIRRPIDAATPTVMEREEKQARVETRTDRPGLILWDLDGPIYNGHLIYDIAEDQVREELLDEEVKNVIFGHRDAYAATDPKYQDYNQLIRDVNEPWARGLAERKIPIKELIAHAEYFMLQHIASFRPYVSEAFTQARRNGYRNVLLTNEPPFVSHAAQKILEADGYIPANWETTGDTLLEGILTGQILVHQDQLNKQEVAQKLREDRRTRPDRRPTLGYGDSMGDRGFLFQVDFPAVTFSKDPKILNFVRQIGNYRDGEGNDLLVNGKPIRRVPDFHEGTEIVAHVKMVTSGNFPLEHNATEMAKTVWGGLPLWLSRDVAVKQAA